MSLLQEVASLLEVASSFIGLTVAGCVLLIGVCILMGTSVYVIAASIDCFGDDEVSSGGMRPDNLNVCNVVTTLAQALCV